MLITVDNAADVAKAIQLALAPVFLLTGIAGLLNVMAGRLSRIIDRGRTLSEGPFPVVPPSPEAVAVELRNLERRRHFTSVAITSCTIAALLLCVAIATLFFDAMLNAPLGLVIGALFTVSTLALVVGLAYFLREVQLATRIRLRVPEGRS